MLELRSCQMPTNELTHLLNQNIRTQHKASDIQKYYVEVGEGLNSVSLYVEESGNPNGIPVVFVHGGPGATFKVTDHQWFDPEKYRIIAYQQRGTHNCVPSAEDLHFDVSQFKDVGIDTLAKDMEALREALHIDQWLVFGGSWGSTLSLYYAEHYPNACTGLVLRGIFLSSESELADFFTEEKLNERVKTWNCSALDRLYTYAKQKDESPTPLTMCSIYRKLIVDKNDIVAARLWTAFENYIENQEEDQLNRILQDVETTPLERTIGVWETQLMNDVITKKIDLLEPKLLKQLQSIPIKIVQGMKDTVCPYSIASDLAAKLNYEGCRVELSLIEEGEHSPYSHPKMIDALVAATDNFAKNKSF